MLASHLTLGDGGVTLHIHRTWRSRWKLVSALLRLHADRVLVGLLGGSVLGIVAAAALGAGRVGQVRLEIFGAALLPVTFGILLGLFVLGLQPTFHWMRSVREIRFAPAGIRATLRSGRTVDPRWAWVARAHRRPFGVEIEVNEPRGARWFVQRESGEEAVARLVDLLVQQGKLPPLPRAPGERRPPPGRPPGAGSDLN
jgi:hypothetical protein